MKAAKSIEGYRLFQQEGKSGYENYEGLFLLANQECDEYILNLENTKNTHTMNFITFVPNSHGGWSGVVPLQSLVDAYETADGLTIDEELYDAIDRVRTRSGMPKTDRTKYHDASTLRELVRRERRVELAFEGLRRADILRWNMASDVMNRDALGCNQGIILDEVSDPVFGDKKVCLDKEPFFVEKRSFKEKDKLFPIPLTELDKNPKLAPNNPGYE